MPSLEIDPTALALLSIFGGAALTGVAGWLGAVLQQRREHARWIREQRLIAYGDWTRLHNRLRYALLEVSMLKESPDSGRADSAERLLAEIEVIRRELPDSLSSVEILGPNEVVDAMREYGALLTRGFDDEAAHDTRWVEVHRQIRRTLSIR